MQNKFFTLCLLAVCMVSISVQAGDTPTVPGTSGDAESGDIGKGDNDPATKGTLTLPAPTPVPVGTPAKTQTQIQTPTSTPALPAPSSSTPTPAKKPTTATTAVTAAPTPAPAPKPTPVAVSSSAPASSSSASAKSSTPTPTKTAVTTVAPDEDSTYQLGNNPLNLDDPVGSMFERKKDPTAKIGGQASKPTPAATVTPASSSSTSTPTVPPITNEQKEQKQKAEEFLRVVGEIAQEKIKPLNHTITQFTLRLNDVITRLEPIIAENKEIAKQQNGIGNHLTSIGLANNAYDRRITNLELWEKKQSAKASNYIISALLTTSALGWTGCLLPIVDAVAPAAAAAIAPVILPYVAPAAGVIGAVYWWCNTVIRRNADLTEHCQKIGNPPAARRFGYALNAAWERATEMAEPLLITALAGTVAVLAINARNNQV